MRKPQPFTIGTKLSNPKCPDSWTSGPSVARASVSQNACDCFSVYLSQAAPRSPPRGAARSHSPVACFTDGDHLNPGSLVRSIKKIALSRQMEGAALGEGTVIMSPRLLAKTAHGNCNNNNSRGLRHISPDGSDFQCDWPVRDPRMIISVAESHKTAKCPGPPSDSALSEIVRTAPPAGSLIRAGEAPSEPPNISQLSLEIKQMVDHVSRTQPPGAASVRSQLQNLRDQWKVLKKTAPNQKCAMGGATILLEFNKKADELEMWMREKEEEPPLHVLLDDNLEKLQITNKIQDLKQERIHYCNLQENINRLGQKLEKQGRPESRAASTRQKHLNRMWLRLQSPLDEYHQSLQLALEVASMWHQADTILRAMEEKSRCAGWRSRDDGRGNQDLRDIASQIMILDVTVSQVSNLHPLLSSRALHKHRQVKERWADLQRTLRTVKSPRTAPCASPSGEPGEALTSGAPKQSSVGNLEQSLLGSCSAESQTEKTNSGDVTLQRAPETFDNTQNGQQHHGPSLTPEVRHLLRELTVTSQWLQGVELLLSEPAAMRSPELIRKDLKQVSKIERELRSRASSVRLRKSERTVTEEVEVKVQEVAERFQTVQDALRRRVSDLRDTLVLSEFMKVVQMEEERKKKETFQMTPRGAARCGRDVSTADRKEMFTPLEELQEAVEMLNDAVKEREQALAATRDATELESRVSDLSQMMATARTKLQDVRSRLEDAEKEFVAVKRETELRGLQGVTLQQQQLETDILGTIGLEVRKLQERRKQPQEFCPAWSQSAGRSIEEALRTWTDLQTLIQENQVQLQKTARLREFFLRYLGMISWTEVTRAQILSESPGGRFSPAQREELERTMEGKLKEFEALAGIGWKLIGEDHLLVQMIRERLEEVQGLLSWLLMRWRCQKQQRFVGNQIQKIKTIEASDNMDAPKDASQFTPGSVALEEFECPEDDDMTPRPAPSGPILRRYRRRALSPILFQSPSCRPPAGTDMEDRVQMPEDCPRKCARGPLWLEPKNLPTGSTSPEPQEEAFTVNTFLNMTEQNTYQSRRVPRGSRNVVPSGRDDLFPASLPHITATMSFKSLRRKEKAQRRTIQGIMGLHSDQKPNPKEASRYRTSTWPPKQEKNIPFSGTPMDLEPFLNYVKNPLTKDIHAECVASGSEKWQHKSPRRGPHTGPSSCQHRTVGRVLTPQITEETDGLDNVHDVISTADSGNDQHPPADEKEVREDLTPSGTRSWLDALTSSSGYCRQNIHGYGKSTASPPSPELEDFIDDFEIDRLSPLVLQYLDPDWGAQEGALNSPESHEAASANCKISHSHRQRGGENTSSPVLREAEGADRAKKQLSSTRSSDHVLHTREAAHLRRDPHSLMETPPDKIVLTKTSSPPEVLHPDHEFLENDDEELEGIWNNAEKVPLLCPAQASHDTAPKEMVGVILPPVKYETLTHIEPYGQVVMGADPNVLVATFTLPASAMLATEMGTEKSPDTWKENSPCQSKSRVPAPENYHPNEISERKSVPSPQSPQPEIIQEKTADSKVIRKLDFHLMEGPLEKKHVLQVGGRKASSRTWGTFYAVLVRRTLCFYPDHKHSTKSSASAPPLHLTGAVCTPESDSTKRGDCFRLRLMDSSEYLFRTPTPESLQRWVTKLRHNSGMEDSDLLRDAALGSDLSPRFMSRSWMPDLCQSRSPRAADIVPVADSPYRKEMKNVAAEVSKHNPHHPLFLESDSAGPNRNLSTRRRRSQSFSSALYQNVTCVSGPWETSSSFSVTLRIDDPLTSRGRCHSFAAPQGETLSRHAADLKPRNKSVFRKFLRRKE